MRELWTVVEKIEDVSLGLIRKGVELSAQRGLKPVVITVTGAGLQTQDTASAQLAAMARACAPEAILLECSHFFSAVAPALAIRLGCGITADCTGLAWSPEHGLLQIRPTFGGRKTAVNRCISMPYIATVRRGTFLKGDFSWPDEAVEHRVLKCETADESIQLLSYIERCSKAGPLESAERILSGGLGLGCRENFEKLRLLAEKTGSALGASRAAVAAGFATYDHQVGQTGASVHPKIYVAFGISGAVQHLSGILGAEKIAVVNTDPKAPICSYADYVLQADAAEVIDKMLAAL